MSVPARECRTCKFWRPNAYDKNPIYGNCKSESIVKKIGAFDQINDLYTDADFGCNLWEVKQELKILRSGE